MKIDSLVMALVLFIAFLTTGIHLMTTNQEYGMYNPGWNGTSDLFSLRDRHTTGILSDLSLLAGRANTTFLIIAPDSSFSESEFLILRKYRMKNRIIIASDDPVGNQILTGIGSTITIDPGFLGSIDRAYTDPYVVVTYKNVQHPLITDVSTMVINKGVALSGGETLMQSSLMSWIDTNGDRRISEGEPFGRYPVMSREQSGEGEVIVLSDPSLFINSMLFPGDEWDNNRFIANILSVDHLFIDQVHSRIRPGDYPGKLLFQLRSDNGLATGFIAVFLLVICLFIHMGIWSGSSEQRNDDSNSKDMNKNGYHDDDGIDRDEERFTENT